MRLASPRGVLLITHTCVTAACLTLCGFFKNIHYKAFAHLRSHPRSLQPCLSLKHACILVRPPSVPPLKNAHARLSPPTLLANALPLFERLCSHPLPGHRSASTTLFALRPRVAPPPTE
eukprot:3638348-Pleurochrysis_carterae.AAC.5